MRKKVLLLCLNKNDYFFPYVEHEGILLEEAYKPAKNKWQSYLIKVLKRIPYMAYFSYGAWKKRVEDFEKIIIFDAGYDAPMQFFFKKYQVLVYVYVWNTIVDVHTKLYRNIIKTKSLPVYSFDKQDCARFGLKYNSMVYSHQIVDKYQADKEEHEKYSLFFVGYDKGRKERLEEIKAYLDKWDMNYYFRIMDQNEWMEYPNYISLLHHSTAILDVVQKGQTGLTIRVMESMFFKKKLVTTNGCIKDYDCYHPSNVFILGEDKLEHLPEFLNGAYVDLPREIVDRYDVEQWILRFDSEKEEIN